MVPSKVPQIIWLLFSERKKSHRMLIKWYQSVLNHQCASKCLSYFLSWSTIHFYLVKGVEILLQGKITLLVFHFPLRIPSSGLDVR